LLWLVHFSDLSGIKLIAKAQNIIMSFNMVIEKAEIPLCIASRQKYRQNTIHPALP